ncbi:MAG: helix-turn-helix domain-containing protein [Pseudomonadota bacterium]
MADENNTPMQEDVYPLIHASGNGGTTRTTSDHTANMAEKAPIRADFEPEYTGQPQAYYDALRQALPEARIGQLLRKVRDAKNVSIEALHEITRHSPQKLISIERMEVSGMSRGYITPVVRDYAKTIGLDGDQLVSDYSSDCGTLETVSMPEPIIAPDMPTKPGLLRPAYAAAAVIGMAIVGGAMFALSGFGDDSKAPDLVVQPLNGAAESLFADIPLTERVRVENLELTLVALQDAWVEVRGPDGTLYRNRIMHVGETYIPRAGAGWTISARNGAAFQWRLGDAVIGPLGPEDAAVFAASVDTAATRAQESAAPAFAAAGNGQPSR